MALLKITHFWSNLLAWGYQHNFPIWGYQHNLLEWGYQHNFPIWGYWHIFQFYGSVGPLECIFMALLTLSNEGEPAHFFHLMEAHNEAPKRKILLCWSSRMQIYGFVENHTFLEQFVRMGVPAQFSNLGVPAHFWSISLVHVLLCNFLDYTVTLDHPMHGYDTVQINGG